AARRCVREQVEEVARVAWGERAAEAPDEGASRPGGEVERAFEPGEVPGRRELADEGRTAADLERDRPTCERLLDDVPAVHVAVGQAESAQHRVDPCRATRRRAADLLQQLVRGSIVREHEHPPEERGEPRARCRYSAELA